MKAELNTENMNVMRRWKDLSSSYRKIKGIAEDQISEIHFEAYDDGEKRGCKITIYYLDGRDPIRNDILKNRRRGAQWPTEKLVQPHLPPLNRGHRFQTLDTKRFVKSLKSFLNSQNATRNMWNLSHMLPRHRMPPPQLIVEEIPLWTRVFSGADGLTSRVFSVTGDRGEQETAFRELSKFFTLRDEGEVTSYLGISYEQRGNNMFIQMSSYADELLADFEMSDCKPVKVTCFVNNKV